MQGKESSVLGAVQESIVLGAVQESRVLGAAQGLVGGSVRLCRSHNPELALPLLELLLEQ